jgi:transcriptional antiterminator RfaH
MPLLPLEPFLYPEDLFEPVSPPSTDASWQWWVLHTRPRAEKSLARTFHQRSLAFFLPLYQRQWRSRGRLRRSFVPLFPGYLFLYGDSQARLTALETNLVARVLPVEDQPQLQADLMRVHRLIRSDTPLTPEARLEPGTRVAITSGPLAGLEGKILRRGKQWKFFVEVQFLQRGVSAEVESWMIQRVDDQRLAAAGR